MELIRSLIFVPGNRENMLERARSFDADIIMVDLEDSVPPGEKAAARDMAREWVPPGEKATARDMAREWVPALRAEGKRVMVRVNSLDTGLTRAELEAVVSPSLHGISLGKIESVRDVRTADRLLSPLEVAAGIDVGTLRIIPWIETAKAVWDARAIAESSSRIPAIAFGAEDFTNDMGIERTDMGEEVTVPRSWVSVAARAAEVGALDSPFVRFRDPDALREDAGRVRRMGYTGKFAIHPAQLEIINETFSPSAEEIEYARRVVEAWEAAEAAGRGSLALDGRMVDVPVVKRARNLLAFADSIAQAGA